MARSKSHKDEEDYRGKVRELEKLNKALKKRLRQLERSKHMWTYHKLDDNEPPEIKEVKPDACPQCFKGSILPIDLGVKMLYSCSACGYRRTTLK